MRRIVRVCLALLLGILMTVNVFADAGMAQYPDYTTDYYVIVESPDGGIDFYTEASKDSTKLNNELIPNGTAFHVEGELVDANKNVWGYTKYHGMTGYIPLAGCRMVTRSEAIKSELSIAETAAADYDYTTAGVKILYNGPGEKFGKVSGSIEIPAGTTVHVVKEAKLADGSLWGYTAYEYEGWIRLEELQNIVDAIDALESVDGIETPAVSGNNAVAGEENSQAGENTEAVTGTDSLNEENSVSTEVKKGEENGISGEGSTTGVAVVAEPTVTNTPTPKPTATNTPKPTATNTPKPTATNTPEPTATNTPTPEPTSTNTPTPEPTSTNTPTPEPTSTNTPTPEATATDIPTPEATATIEPTATEEAEETVTPAVTEAAQDEQASSANVEEADLLQNPLIWIGGICILLIILILIYHLIKKNK